MAFSIPADGNQLTSATLTGNFAQCANITATAKQTFAGPLAIPGITNTASLIVNTRLVTDSPTIIVATTDLVIFINLITPAASTVTLPTGAAGRWLIVKDVRGDAATNHITLTGNVDGGANYVINQNYGHVTLCYNGSTWSTL